MPPLPEGLPDAAPLFPDSPMAAEGAAPDALETAEERPGPAWPDIAEAPTTGDGADTPPPGEAPFPGAIAGESDPAGGALRPAPIFPGAAEEADTLFSDALDDHDGGEGAEDARPQAPAPDPSAPLFRLGAGQALPTGPDRAGEDLDDAAPAEAPGSKGGPAA